MMRTSHFITGILVAALAVSATSTLAFGPRAGGHASQMSFEELDVDGDGQITQSEMASHATARFDAADTDADGTLSATELQARAQQHLQERVAGMITRFDKNGDGVLSLDELPKRGGEGRMFRYFDLDASGGISQPEFEEARDEMRDHAKGQMGQHQGGHWAPHRNKN